MPLKAGLKKLPLFFMKHFDGHAREDVESQLKVIIEALVPHNIEIVATPTDSDPHWGKQKSDLL